MSKLAHAGASSTTPAGFASANAFSTASSSDAASWTSTTPASAARTSGRASPIATTALARGASGVPKHPQVAALEPAADDRHESRLKALDRTARRLDVRRLRVVDEPDAVDVSATSSIACSRPWNDSTAAVIAAGAAPAIAPTVAAAITSSTRCGPRRWIASSGTSRSVRGPCRSTIQPASPRLSRQPMRFARTAAAMRARVAPFRAPPDRRR